jgi:dolichol-phosphate mannosyltransferase
MTEMSIVLPAINEADNLSMLLPRLHEVARSIGPYEIMGVDGGSTDDTAARAGRHGARVHFQRERGYGQALREAFALASGRYIVTMDADYSHDPFFIRDLYGARDRGAVVVASRYVPGGSSEAGGFRSFLSRILNFSFRRILSIPIYDMSSGFRLYHREALAQVEIGSRHFDALEEVLIKIVGLGYPVCEVPFVYKAREKGASKARVLKFGFQLLRTLHRLWQLRNSCEWCDYDHRAYDSAVFLQRWWQRRRHRIIAEMHAPGGKTLDIGCGSSRILEALSGAVGVDVSMPKLRFMAARGCRTLQASNPLSGARK